MASFSSSFTLALVTVLIVLMIGPDQIMSKRSLPELPSNQCSSLGERDCRCGRRINVTVKAINKFVSPFFEIETTVTRFPQRPLLFFLEQAANQDGRFNFTSTYYPTLGYFIDSINGRRGFNENKTFWHIIGQEGVGSLQCGASTFVPQHEDLVLFNFTTWAQAGFDY